MNVKQGYKWMCRGWVVGRGRHCRDFTIHHKKYVVSVINKRV